MLLRLLTSLTCLLPLICLGVMVRSNLEGETLATILATLFCFTSARSALLLIRLSRHRSTHDRPQ